jgi:RimJ/RimL family protein N-acetyltransferase
MLSDHYPLAGLRLTTPRLTLCLPDDDQLGALADLALDGVHDPDRQPFGVPWTDESPAARARATVTYHWLQRSQSTPKRWNIDFVVLRDGVVAGTQGIRGVDFAIVREVSTGSWLGQKFHGEGIGTEMRAAVLYLAFEGLGAQRATSSAFEDNAPSGRVSEKLGYVPDGTDWQESRGKRAVMRRLVLTRESWERHRSVPVTIEGLTDSCRAEFGLSAG